MNSIDIQTLNRFLRYDPKTGDLFWRNVQPSDFSDSSRTREHTCSLWNSKYAGKEALTCANASGHRKGNVRGVGLLAHRVAWALFYGEWPDQFIDHIDMDPANNRIENLRLATKRQNGCNRKPIKHSSKYLGVGWHKAAGKWKAAISVNGKVMYLGVFGNEEDAAKAYDRAAKEKHGEFARLNFNRTDA